MAAISTIIAGVGLVAGIAQQASARRDQRQAANEARRQAQLTAQGNAMAQQSAIQSRQAQQQVAEITSQAATQTEQLNVSTNPGDAERNRRRTVRQDFGFTAGSGAGTSGGVRL